SRSRTSVPPKRSPLSASTASPVSPDEDRGRDRTRRASVPPAQVLATLDDSPRVSLSDVAPGLAAVLEQAEAGVMRDQDEADRASKTITTTGLPGAL
ncbi:hypothetical protein HDU93_003378, partial [Gonapodya sp. JEL0774]